MSDITGTSSVVLYILLVLVISATLTIALEAIL